MADEIMTFDEILADPTYKAEFDRRVTKALSTVQAKLNTEVEKNKKFEAAADGETIESLQNKLKELQDKYDKETEAYKAQLTQRDYQAAIDKAIADSGVKFSSKSAEKAFRAGIGDSKLEMKDGALDGFDKYLEKAKSEDPSAFVKAGARVDTQGSLEGGPRETTPTSLLGALHEKYDK